MWDRTYQKRRLPNNIIINQYNSFASLFFQVIVSLSGFKLFLSGRSPIVLFMVLRVFLSVEPKKPCQNEDYKPGGRHRKKGMAQVMRPIDHLIQPHDPARNQTRHQSKPLFSDGCRSRNRDTSRQTPRSHGRPESSIPFGWRLWRIELPQGHGHRHDLLRNG